MSSGIYFSLLIYLPTCLHLRFSWNCRCAVLFIVDAEQTRERKIHVGHCKSFGDYCPCRRNTVNTCLTYNTVTASARFYWQQWRPTLLSGYLAHSLPLPLTSSLSLPPSLYFCRVTNFEDSPVSRRALRCPDANNVPNEKGENGICRSASHRIVRLAQNWTEYRNSGIVFLGKFLQSLDEYLYSQSLKRTLKRYWAFSASSLHHWSKWNLHSRLAENLANPYDSQVWLW